MVGSARSGENVTLCAFVAENNIMLRYKGLGSPEKSHVPPHVFKYSPPIETFRFDEREM
jgi:hypothetical protein